MEDLQVSSAALLPLEPNGGAVEALQGMLRGRVIRRSDDEYESARKVWNGMIDRHPVLIVRCRGTSDVMNAVRFARTHKLPVAVRGGAHNVAGSAVCDDGIVIDLSEMRGVRVDPARKTVRAEGGARLGDLDHEAQAFGLAVPTGVVSRTGIGGLTLHGGMGFLTRRFGLTCDHLISADVVTASGQLVVASETENSELLWALRGGGGSFGVVTSFEFQARTVGPDVWMGLVFYPLSKGQKVLRFLRTHMAEAPDELMAVAVAWTAPEGEPIPEAHRGAPVVVVAACWSGPLEAGEDALRPLRTIDAPIADLSGPMRFVEAQRIFDPEYPDGRRYYWKSIYLDSLSDAAIDLLVESASSRPSPLTSIDVWMLGGAMSRVRPDSSAFFERTAPNLIGIESNWDDPADDEENLRWSRDLFGDLQRFSSGRAYFNFPGFLEEGEDLLQKSFGPNYDRLREIKKKYDPENLFRYNLRIPAAT